MRRLQHSFLIAARPAHIDPDPVSEFHIRPSLLQNCLLQWVSAKKKRFFTPKNKKSQKKILQQGNTRGRCFCVLKGLQ